MNGNDIEAELGVIRDEIFSGSFSGAAKRLFRLRKARVPRRLLGQMAWAARRLEQPSVAVRLLARVVKGGPRVQPRASAQELAEYAMSLGQLGVLAEAERLLGLADPREYQEVVFYRALICFNRHDYAAAIGPLEQYLALPGVTLQGRMAARVRIAHALTYAPAAPALTRASRLLEDVIDETRPGGALWWFRRYALEIRAWNAYFRGDREEARKWLEKARLEHEQARDELGLLDVFAWKAVVAGRPQDLRRDELTRAGRWEMLRLADFEFARASGDRDLLAHLYYGTPWPAFRSLVQRHLQPVPEQYEWRLSPIPRRAAAGARVRQGTAWLDAASGAHSLSEASLGDNRALQRALSVLSSDFYRPISLCELFEGLYASEPFDPDHSPERAHRVLRRLRQWFKSQNLPLGIEERNQLYRLVATTGLVTIRLHLNPKALVPHGLARTVERARKAFGRGWFSAAELGRLLGVSARMGRKVAARAAVAGLLQRTGSGRATRYRDKTR